MVATGNGRKRWYTKFLRVIQINVAAGLIPSALLWPFPELHNIWRVNHALQARNFTYDGVTHYVNRSYPARPHNVSEINVAFQMDGDSKQTAYSAWLDKVSLTGKRLLVNRRSNSRQNPWDHRVPGFYLLPALARLGVRLTRTQ